MDACNVNQGACHRGKKWAFFLCKSIQPINTVIGILPEQFCQLEVVTLSMCVVVSPHTCIICLYIGIRFVQEIHNLDPVCMTLRHLLD
jgi:hypothetical protein